MKIEKTFRLLISKALDKNLALITYDARKRSPHPFLIKRDLMSKQNLKKTFFPTKKGRCPFSQHHKLKIAELPAETKYPV